MNKVELTNSIFRIADMWHLDDYVADDEIEQGFLYTLQYLMNYEADEIENLMDGLRNECENAIENGWNQMDSYKPSFDLYDQVMVELEDLLSEC